MARRVPGRLGGILFAAFLAPACSSRSPAPPAERRSDALPRFDRAGDRFALDATGTYGFDPNETRRCVATTGCPGATDFYALDTDCAAPLACVLPEAGVATDTRPVHWLVAVESESNATLGASCPGPMTRSFPIDAAGSPIALTPSAHPSSLGPNWTWQMTVDKVGSPPPASCGDPTQIFTWYSFQDNVETGAAPLPDPFHGVTSHTLSFDSLYVPAGWPAAGGRVFVSAGYFWGGRSHQIEVNLALFDWGPGRCATGSDGGVPKCLVTLSLACAQDAGVGHDGGPCSLGDFVALYGAAYGLTVAPGGAGTTITVDWPAILNDAIANGWIRGPAPGEPVATTSYGIGIEVRGNARLDLWQTDFRVSSK